MDNRVNFDFNLKDNGLSNSLDSINLPRHRWYFYKEGFSPNLVEKAIKESKLNENSLVIDPFNGSGTTTLTASLFGINSIGVEVNPFTHFLSSTKLINYNTKRIKTHKEDLFKAINRQSESPLLTFSTFSEKTKKDKYLFNSDVLNSFEGGWQHTENLSSPKLKKIFQLALIISAMKNCNAKRDGKCLRYRDKWRDNKFGKDSFIESLSNTLDEMVGDIEASNVKGSSKVYNSDIRKVINRTTTIDNFDLCVTSPPYLNTFDYTDIYRPELYLGKFVTGYDSLYKLRLKTVRSHVQAKWKKPLGKEYGAIYTRVLNDISKDKDLLMHKNIPLMIQAYFEDMHKVLQTLKTKCAPKGSLWMVVSNSAYANTEIPLDLILADIGTSVGWRLKEIGVLRNVRKRKTKYSPDINFLRESVIIFENK